MSFDTQAVLALMDAYIATWNAGDFAATAACFSFPTLFISAAGDVLLRTEQDALDHLNGIRSRLATAAFARSVWGARAVFPLGEDLALASCEFVRVDVGGRPIETSTGTYTVRRTGTGWKIVACVVHAGGTGLHARAS